MAHLASPLRIASLASALLWPLAAGVAALVRAKVRARNHDRPAEAGASPDDKPGATIGS